MKTFGNLVALAIGVLAVPLLSAAQEPAFRHAPPDAAAAAAPRTLAPYFTTATSQPKAPDADGFLQRWMLLEPIVKPNRTNTVFTGTYVRNALNTQYFPDQFAVLPRSGDTETVAGQALASLGAAVDGAAERLAGNAGRLVYAGAGSSGLLAAIDAVELGPTYDWPEHRMAVFLAGGLDLAAGEDAPPERVLVDGHGAHRLHDPRDGAVDEGFAKAARNLPKVDVLPTQGANVYDILRRDTLVLTRAAVEQLEARLK